jgi:hypothetical protein
MIGESVLNERLPIPTSIQRLVLLKSTRPGNILQEHHTVQGHKSEEARHCESDAVITHQTAKQAHVLLWTTVEPPEYARSIDEWIDLEMDPKTQEAASEQDTLLQSCPQQCNNDDHH